VAELCGWTCLDALCTALAVTVYVMYANSVAGSTQVKMYLNRNLHHKVCNAQMQTRVYAKAHHVWLEDGGGASPPAHWQHAVSCWPSWRLPQRLPPPVLPAWHGLPPSVKQSVTLQLDTDIPDCSIYVWSYNAGLAIGNATMQ